MIAATIDIGTNTTLALLADGDGSDLKVLKDQQTPNRLGESMREDNEISAHAIAMNVDLLGEIMRDYRRYGAEDFAVCGTSALRRARNRDEFVSAVRDVFDLQVDILSGTDEAALTFAGAVSGKEIYPHEKIGVIDLGGGSTEVIEGQGLHAGQSCSLDMGAVYLTNEYFMTEEIPSVKTIERLRLDVRERLIQLLNSLRDGVYPWLLVGGTAVTLSMLKQGLRRYDADRIRGSQLTLKDIKPLCNSFIGKHPEELQALPGMPLSRGKYILAGTLLMIELFDALQIEQAEVSERGLRHGLWLMKFAKRGIA
ncbi:hypothetical protein KKC97_12110 [bacterium]|nr:hypothetical protein [bacterium]MBU1638399.1 hypothetical protein [bacterium]MBU1921095.1 hypothetical protein [bacterium]